MKHRYVVWAGRYKGRRWTELHIIDHLNKPICNPLFGEPTSLEDKTIWSGSPDGYHLCQNCRRKRAAFEQAEKLRTWQAMGAHPQ